MVDSRSETDPVDVTELVAAEASSSDPTHGYHLKTDNPAWSLDEDTDTTPLSANLLEYRTLHGRTFQSLKGSPEYWGPNDEQQQDSMDMSHHVYTLRLDGRLFLAPIDDSIKKALDVGTGTGIWAIDFADEFPSTEVIATDVAPIQPNWVPPNLRFEIDDATLEWTWDENTFDFVHERTLLGSIADWPAFFANAFRALKPGGWFESVEITVSVKCDDESFGPGHVLDEWGELLIEAGRRTGRPLNIVDEHLTAKWMKEAGFVDVVEEYFKVPVSGWSSDPNEKEIGQFSQRAIEEGMEGYGLYLLTQAMGWTHEQLQVFLASVRKALKSKKNHGYYVVAVVYGRKPEVE